MKIRLVGAVIGALLVTLGLVPTSASAATEFGDTCTATTGGPVPYTVTTLSAPPGPIPLTAPTSGVITKVKMNVAAALPFAIPGQAKLLRSAGGNNFTVTNQTNVNIGTGQTVADARMPVSTDERLAFHGLPFSYLGTDYPGFIFICASPGSKFGFNPGDVSPGSTAEFAESGEAIVPLAAIIEPDADNDGYGDETQDGCPQSAAVQVPCPPVNLSATKQVNKGSVVIVATTDSAAAVTVKGVVKLGKGRKAKLNGGTKSLTPGVLGKFTLKFTKKVKAKLAELSPKQSLTLKATVTGTNVAGQVTKKTLKVKLKGQAKG